MHRHAVAGADCNGGVCGSTCIRELLGIAVITCGNSHSSGGMCNDSVDLLLGMQLHALVRLLGVVPALHGDSVFTLQSCSWWTEHTASRESSKADEHCMRMQAQLAGASKKPSCYSCQPPLDNRQTACENHGRHINAGHSPAYPEFVSISTSGQSAPACAAASTGCRLSSWQNRICCVAPASVSRHDKQLDS